MAQYIIFGIVSCIILLALFFLIPNCGKKNPAEGNEPEGKKKKKTKTDRNTADLIGMEYLPENHCFRRKNNTYMDFLQVTTRIWSMRPQMRWNMTALSSQKCTSFMRMI